MSIMMRHTCWVGTCSIEQSFPQHTRRGRSNGDQSGPRPVQGAAIPQTMFHLGWLGLAGMRDDVKGQGMIVAAQIEPLRSVKPVHSMVASPQLPAAVLW